jgi:hypothetical protein
VIQKNNEISPRVINKNICMLSESSFFWQVKKNLRILWKLRQGARRGLPAHAALVEIHWRAQDATNICNRTVVIGIKPASAAGRISFYAFASNHGALALGIGLVNQPIAIVINAISTDFGGQFLPVRQSIAIVVHSIADFRGVWMDRRVIVMAVCRVAASIVAILVIIGAIYCPIAVVIYPIPANFRLARVYVWVVIVAITSPDRIAGQLCAKGRLGAAVSISIAILIPIHYDRSLINQAVAIVIYPIPANFRLARVYVWVVIVAIIKR